MLSRRIYIFGALEGKKERIDQMACNLRYKYSSERAVTVTVNEGIHHKPDTHTQTAG